ncbi:hypothetical protein PT974_03663 [Cladobotryum mycophilum]|uniref:NACHT domain-containing protein n=1 Tax=Cladobotryum mycophilum TaxID=491253 RepID=A0ABR0ST24_9HYPO
MDPLSALGMASNTVRFVHFASKLVSSACAISKSAEGASQHNLDLEKVYQKLQTFSSELADPAQGASSQGDRDSKLGNIWQPADSPHKINVQKCIQSLDYLTRDCNGLCEELLATVQKLRVKPGPNRLLRSFRVAIRTVWSSKDIEGLQARIDQYRKAIALNFFPLLSQQQFYLLSALTALRDESFKLQLDQSSKFDKVMARLAEIKQSMPSGPESVNLDSSGDPGARTRGAGIVLEEDPTGNVTKMDLDDIESLVDGVSGLSVTEADLAVIARQQTFLKSLDFKCRPLRHEDIPLAHKLTFKWTLEPEDKSRKEEDDGSSRLYTWLRSGHGLFWVSGKAGSGKSTLMKFVADHEQTQRLLKVWAGSQKLATAKHYFWTGGTAMQKTQKGLLQSLLYDIFRSCPEQIPEICPQRWLKTRLGHSTSQQHTEWLVTELLEALWALGSRSGLRTKYCVFIDGIDEFDGDHYEMAQLLNNLSKSPNFKFCLSSRPWNVFEDTFGIEPSQKLYVHQLTRQDILAYTRARLSEHCRWSETNFPRGQMDALIHNITERTQGVFLWVFLVTRSLRDGLVNGDTMNDLERRLKRLPTDLEPFFKHMLDLVDPLYHQRMAIILRIAINARHSLNLEFFHVQEFEEEDEDYAINRSTESYSSQNRDSVIEQCQRRINAQCGGLLEIKHERVEFLHRTVRDFLLTRELSDYLEQKSGQDFMVNLSTLKAFVFLFKNWVQSTDWLTLADEQPFWREGLEYANEAFDESTESALKHLDAVEDLFQDVSCCSDSIVLDITPDFVFRTEIIRVGVFRHVALKLKEYPDYFNSKVWTDNHMRILAQLLESGHDPNDDVGGPSPWYRFVQRTCLGHGARKDIAISAAMRDDIEDEYTHAPPNRIHLKPKIYPCTHFIEALFSYGTSHRSSQQCLGALDDFFDLSEQDGSSQLEEVSETAKIFNKSHSEVRHKGVRAGLDMESLVTGLLAVFPGSGSSALVDMIRKREGSQSRGLKSGALKRCQGERASTSSHKRQKVLGYSTIFDETAG